MPNPHALYRFYDETGQLLYVGISVNPGARFAQHRSDKPWWGDVVDIKVQPMSTRKAALEAERDAIKNERPMYNLVHREPACSVSVSNADDLHSRMFRMMFTAREQGGEHVQILAEGARQRGLSEKEASVLAWTEWTDHHLHELNHCLQMLIAQFSFAQVAPIRQTALAELVAHGHGVWDMELLELTARTLATDLAKRHLASIPAIQAEEAVARFSYEDGDVGWEDIASEVRGWSWFGDMSVDAAFYSGELLSLTEQGGDDDQ